MSLQIQDILSALKLDTKEFEQGLSSAENDSAKFSKSFAQKFSQGAAVAGTALTTLVTVPMMAMFQNGETELIKFEDVMKDMKVRTTLTSAEMQRLSDSARSMTENFAEFNEYDAIEGMTKLAQAGENVDTILQNMPEVLNLASAAQMKVADTAELVATTMNQYGLSTSEAGRVTDVFAAAQKRTLAPISELASLMRYMSSTMSSAGYSLEETTAYVIAFSNAGLVARQSSGALQTAVQSLSSVSDVGQRVLDRLGVSIKDSTGHTKSLIDVVTELKSKGASATDMIDVFGESTQRITEILANLGKDGFNNIVDGLNKSKGAAEQAGEAMQEGLEPVLESIKQDWQNVFLDVGKAIGPFATEMEKKMQTVTHAISDFVAEFKTLPKETQEWILKIGGVVAAIGPLLLALASITSALGFINAQLAIMVASPAFWVLMGLGAAVGATVLTINAIKEGATPSKETQQAATSAWARLNHQAVQGGRGTINRGVYYAPEEGEGSSDVGTNKHAAPSSELLSAAEATGTGMTQAQIDAAKKAAEAIKKANEDARDALAKITMDETQYALKQLDDLMKQWRASGVEEVTIEAYSAAQKKIIWNKYYADVAEQAKKAAEELAAAQEEATKGVEAMQEAEETAREKATEEWQTYNDNLKDFQNSISDFLKEKYQEEYRAKQKVLDDNLDATLAAYKKEEDAADELYDKELASINDITDAKLAQLDADLDQLNARRQAGKDATEQADLQKQLAEAATVEERDAILVKIADLKQEMDYNAAVTAIEQQKASIKEQAKAEQERLKKANEDALASIKAEADATQAAYDSNSEELKKFYTNKMLQRNLDAEAELMTQQMTHQQILTMMESQLTDYAKNGYEAGDSWWNAFQEAVKSGMASLVAPVPYTLPETGGKPIPSYASGGWAGLNGPEIVRVGESGPEYISSSEPKNNDMSNTLLRSIVRKLDELNVSLGMVAPSVGIAVNGIGRL